MSLKTRYTLLFLFCCAMIVSSTPSWARWGDGTGPEGQGPRTGRQAGYCAGYSVPGYQNTEVPRRGAGRADTQRGGGRGQRRGMVNM